MMTRRTYVWSALALAALLFFGLNSFAGAFFTDTRLDLTQSGQFTLARGTRNIIAKLPEPVTLRFYFSSKNSANYPATAAYAKRVRDLLGEYASLSNGKIILEDVDPEPFTTEEDQANAAGIKPAPTEQGDSVYFGLEGINSIDDKEVIPYFGIEREAYLEYDLTSLLYQLSHPEKPKLAVISGLPLTAAPGSAGQGGGLGGQGQPLTIYAQLQRDYAVSLLPDNFTAIPPGTNVLLLAHPGQLTAPQLKQIEIYVVKGGRALVFIDPFSELVAQEGQAAATPSSDVPLLLKGWGIDYSPLKVVLDRQLAQRIQAPDGSGRAISYPLWLHLTAGNFASRDPVTASMQGLNLASVGALSPIKGATTHFEPLVWSSSQASLMPRDEAQAIRDPNQLVDAIQPTGKPFTIAARITGPAVFPGVAKGNMNIIVMADTDIFDDRFWLRQGEGGAPQPFADNEGFVLNAVENLAGSDDMISLRTRGNVDRPFTVVQGMQAEAELKFRETLINLQSRLQASEQQIAQLQQGGGGGGTALSPEQSAAIDKAKHDIAGTRAQLRDVQHNLRGDIDALGTVLAFLNILLMPLLVAAFAIAFGVIRRGRARRRLAAGAA
jgi:ABC-type uncharacterized transport system involved in gliding motility auxiliary subunit